MNKYYEKLMDHFNKTSDTETSFLIDKNIDFDIAQDYFGDTYFIVDCQESKKKLESIIRKTLNVGKNFDIEEETGIYIGFSDEYSLCYICSTIIHTIPDSAFWQPNFFYNSEGLIICEKCINDEECFKEEYIESRVNNPCKTVNKLVSIEDVETLGFKKIQAEFDSDTNDPQDIYKKLSKEYNDVLFYTLSSTPFSSHFIVMVR